MANYNQWQHSDDQYEVGFEKIHRSPKHHSSREKQQRIATSHAKPVEQISALKRSVAAKDARNLRRAVESAIGSDTMQKHDLRTDKFGLSLLPPRYARKLYRNFYHAPNDNGAGLKEFNAKVNEFSRTDPIASQPLSVYLGEVRVLGSSLQYVASIIKGGAQLSVEQMKEEHMNLVYHLTGNEREAAQAARGCVPHLTLAHYAVRSFADTAARTLDRVPEITASGLVALTPAAVIKSPLT